MLYNETKHIEYYPTHNKYLINTKYMMVTVNERTKNSQMRIQLDNLLKMVFRLQSCVLPRFVD